MGDPGETINIGARNLRPIVSAARLCLKILFEIMFFKFSIWNIQLLAVYGIG